VARGRDPWRSAAQPPARCPSARCKDLVSQFAFQAIIRAQSRVRKCWKCERLVCFSSFCSELACPLAKPEGSYKISNHRYGMSSTYCINSL
jgi:hypothetical protein